MTEGTSHSDRRKPAWVPFQKPLSVEAVPFYLPDQCSPVNIWARQQCHTAVAGSEPKPPPTPRGAEQFYFPSAPSQKSVITMAVHCCRAEWASGWALAHTAVIAITLCSPSTLTFVACSTSLKLHSWIWGSFTRQQCNRISCHTVAWQGLILQMHVSAAQIAFAKCHRQLTLLPAWPSPCL